MFQQRRAALRAGLIADAAVIRAIASPVRQELVDTLEALGGTATIAELAEQLGRPADGLYYHVEILERAGLFVAAPGGTSRAGRSERRYRTPTRSGAELRLVYRPRHNAAAVRGVVASMLRIARRDFDRALVDDVVVAGAMRELWASRGTGWVSDADLAEINRLLRKLSGLLRRPRGGARQRLISLCFVIAPMKARAKRRSSPKGLDRRLSGSRSPTQSKSRSQSPKPKAQSPKPKAKAQTQAQSPNPSPNPKPTSPSPAPRALIRTTPRTPP